MPLTGDQLTYLKTADQRFRAHVQLFPAYTPTVTPPSLSASTGTALSPKPMIQFSPRYSTANNSGTVEIYAGDSYLRGGGAAGTKNWSTDVGSLSAATGDTVTFTAPASGSGVATITVTCANAAGTSTSYAYVAYPKITYDEMVAEIVSIQGSLTQHGWKATLRIRGAATDFVIGKRVLIHIEDSWNGTTSTFGGYKYPEGVLVGYITEAEYFEDWAGDQWLGVEVQSPWWVLSRTKVGEVWFGTTNEAGKYYLAGFTPVDAIWKFVQDLTDFAQQHNVVLWFDQNIIDDFITEESDLGTLFDDIMGRTLSIAYTDRYGALFCVPDPDVRAQEYWGTPASTYVLTPDFVTNYNIQQQPYQVRKLVLAAFDSSKLGIYAVSENPTAPGDIQTIRGLLCDSNTALVRWAVDKRAQMNRTWWLEATHPLNHVLDLNNFVDAIFTAPGLSGAPTASAQVYADSISYRPNIADGGWLGSVRYLKRTLGDGTAETGGVSGWGGTGSNWGGPSAYSGSGQFGVGGWEESPQGITAWCRVFDWVTGHTAYFSAVKDDWGFVYSAGAGLPGAHYTSGDGWRPASAKDNPVTDTAMVIRVGTNFQMRTITGVKLWGSAPANALVSLYAVYSSQQLLTENTENGEFAVSWDGEATASGVAYFYIRTNSNATAYFKSAMIAGIGTNPYGGDNC